MKNKQEIFQPIFAQSWQDLPNVLRRHYGNRSFCNDITVFSGMMDVYYSKFFALFLPFFKFFKTLIPHQGHNIAVTVKYLSDPNSDFFYINRTFHFAKKDYVFNSKMLHLKNSEVAEFMRFGIGWKMDYIYENSKIILRHKNYFIKIFNFLLPLTFLNFVLGKNYCEEIALSDDEFFMKLQMRHSWLGVLFEYKGKFKFISYEQK